MLGVVRFALSGLTLVATISPLWAATAKEDLAKRWLEASAFGLPVAIGQSTFNPASQSVEFGDVVIGRKGTDLVVVTLPDLTLEDPRLTADGQFAAHALRASTVRIDIHVDVTRWFPDLAALAAREAAPQATPAPSPDAGDQAAPDSAAPPTATLPVFDVVIATETLLIERLVMPMDPPVIPANADLLTSYLAYVKASLTTRADWAEVNNVRIETVGAPDGDSLTTYELCYLTALHDGRAERSGFNAMEQIQTVDGTMVSAKIESAYAIGLDGNAVIEAMDPAAYAGGKGDGRWRTAAAQYGYNNFDLTFPNGSISLGNVEINGLRVRQTDKPPFAALSRLLIDPSIVETDPAGFIRDILPGVFGFYGVDFVQAANFEVKVTVAGETEPASFTIGEFDLNDADSDGVGAFTLRTLAMDMGATGSGSLNLMTFNDLRFGTLASWIDLITASFTGSEPSPALVTRAVLEGSPTLGFFEIGTLAIETPMGAIGVDAFAVTQADFFKAIPRRYETTFTKLSFPVALLTDPAVKDPLTAMGYETLALSGGSTFTWDTDKGDIRFEDATVKVADMGTLSMDMHLGNLPLSILDNPDTIEQRMQEGTLVSAGLTFGNQSIVEKTFEMKAKELNQKPEDFRTNFANALPLMLGFLDDKQIQTTFQDVLQTFFKDPQSLVVSIKPAAPLPFTVFDTIQSEAPGETLKLLGFDIRANE